MKRQCLTVANKSDVFQRLVGLETEYALHIAPSAGQRVSRYGLFRDLLLALRKKLPTARARHMKEGVFHAAGGAVWFETERPATGGGLIEGSTPECRSPLAVIAWQRAQDELLSEAAEDAFGGGVRLVKNDRDADGNVYGAQESYEAVLASGWRLRMWRIFLVFLAPLALATWLALWLLDRLVTTYVLAATVLYLAVERLLPRPERLARLLFGCSVKELETDIPTGPVWLEAFLTLVTRLVTAPLAILMLAALRLTAFTRVRRQMLPFLASRSIIAGAGMIDDNGRYQISDKGPSINCAAGLGLWGERSVFALGNFLKAINADIGLVFTEYRQLFSARQRLQIAAGDSNMAELAEYLRVGTTMLVLDCIEAGEMPPVPRLLRPIRALRAIGADATLTACVPLAGGKSATALELQRFYLEACRRFLARRPNAPVEAREVFHRWETTLDVLEDDPQSLVGSIDWVTKQFVLDKAGRRASWEARKKIDIRYHELSPQGYFERLKMTGIVLELLSRSEIDHARRNPPAGTPAAARGRYIREFSVDEHELSVNWRYVFLAREGKTRVIRLDGRGGAKPISKTQPKKTSRRHDAGS